MGLDQVNGLMNRSIPKPILPFGRHHRRWSLIPSTNSNKIPKNKDNNNNKLCPNSKSPFPSLSTKTLATAARSPPPADKMSISNGFGGSLSSSYDAAMEALSSLISRRKRGDGSTRGNKFHLMFKYLEILGLEEHLSSLRIIHVAGTKGKGSTCTFSEAILRECGFRTDLFTSPHLIDVRERYRINGSIIKLWYMH